MSLTPQWLDELRTRVTLSGVIQRTTRLTRAGREWKACCPFHNEKSPSFTVNDEKGFYHCFGCGAHGDVIRWMTDQRGLAFMDAVKELAAEAGMELPAPDPRAAARAEREQSLHDVMAAAQAFFVDQLASPGGAEARDYLARRGVPAEVQRAFGFGFAPDSRTAIRQALGQFPVEMLVEAGLLIAVDDKTPYDRFRARLMLPIADARGRVIAFGGRILDSNKSEAAKYLNSPDTPLFDKGRTLYNLHRAAPAARAARRVLVVEGYMDAVALAAAGIGEVVAPLGTALTEHQIERLWRVHECPVLCLDGDAAGQRAAMRAAVRALPLLRPGHSLRIVTLPEGMDPDDLVKRSGRAGFEAALEAAGRSLVDLIWQVESAAAPLVTPEDKAGLKARLLAHVETIADRDIAALYRRDLLERFSELAFPRRERTAQPRARTGGNRTGGPWKPPEATLAPTETAKLNRVGTYGALLAAVIAGLVRYPQAIAEHAESLAGLGDSEAALAGPLGAVLDAFLSAGETASPLESATLETILHANGLSLDELVRASPCRFAFFDAKRTDGRAELDEAIALLVERPAIEAALIEATRRFDTDPDGAFEEQQRLRKRKLAFEQRLLQMARAVADNG